MGYARTDPLRTAGLTFDKAGIMGNRNFKVTVEANSEDILKRVTGVAVNRAAPLDRLAERVGSFVEIMTDITVIATVIFFVINLMLNCSVNVAFDFTVNVFITCIPRKLPTAISMGLIKWFGLSPELCWRLLPEK